MPSLPIDQTIANANVAITNALATPDIQASLTEWGYDADRIQEGKQLLDALMTVQDALQQELGEQYAATEQLSDVRAGAHETYSAYVKVARIALRERPDARQALRLDEPRRRAFAAWYEQARTFYANAVAREGVLEALGTFNITREKLEGGRDAMESVMKAKEMQEREKGDVDRAYVTRDEALDALDDWMSDFLTVARVALADDAQLLEKMGLVTPR